MRFTTEFVTLFIYLGGVQFVSNIVFGSIILEEKITKKGVLATSLIVIGLLISVSFSDHTSKTYSTVELIALYDDTYMTFIVLVILLLLTSEVIYVVYTNREQNGYPLPYSIIIRPATYSLVSATVGTQSVLQSKCLAELLRTHIIIDKNSGNNLFSNWLIYVVLTAFVVGLLFWLYRLNNALKLFDGLVIIPIIQVYLYYIEICLFLVIFVYKYCHCY